MSYTIIKGGEILRVVNCRPGRLAAHLGDGETYVDGAYPSGQYRIGARGQPVLQKKAEREAAQFHAELVKPRALIRALVADLEAAGIDLPSVKQLLSGR